MAGGVEGYTLISSTLFFLAQLTSLLRCSVALPRHHGSASLQLPHTTMSRTGPRPMKGGEPIDTSKGAAATPAKECVVSKTKGKGMSSTAMCGQLDRLTAGGYLPSTTIAFARSLGTVADNSGFWTTGSLTMIVTRDAGFYQGSASLEEIISYVRLSIVLIVDGV